MSSKILITGGAGFIGTHLCRALVKSGHEVRVLDLVWPKDEVQGVQYLQGDVRDLAILEEAIHGVHVVYHFAAIVSMPQCQKNPIESYETNFLSTLRVCEIIVKESQKQSSTVRLIYSGSASVYGNVGRAHQQISETELTPEPQSFYAAQKLASEHVIGLYHRAYGLSGVVFRFFNVFGQGQDPHSPYSGVITVFSEAIRGGAPLNLNGGGIQTRDFVSVHDVTKACELALCLSESKCDGHPINLGSGKSTAIFFLAEEMIKISKSQSFVQSVQARAGDVLHSRADIRRAHELLSWSPEISLHEGLLELL